MCAGWGVWGGEGTRQVKRVKDKPREAVKHRSDRELGHVIISDHSNTKINKHLVSSICCHGDACSGSHDVR